MNPEQSKKPESEIKTKLLSELGPTLPIGLMDSGGVYHRDFSIRRWRLREERELGTLVQSQQSTLFGQYVSLVLAQMCTKIGMHDFGQPLVQGNSSPNKKLVAERLALISGIYLADVIYAYLWLRVQTMGPKLLLDLPCPNCRTKFPFDAVLDTIEVRTIEKIEDAEWTFELREPIDIRGSEARELIIRPPIWSAVTSLGAATQNFGEIKASVIHSSIYAVVGAEPVPLAKHEFDDLGKLDFETLTTEIDERSIGPDLSIETECPTCKREIQTSIEWISEDFFGVSSRSKI